MGFLATNRQFKTRMVADSKAFKVTNTSTICACAETIISGTDNKIST